jgi:hypothetical protein
MTHTTPPPASRSVAEHDRGRDPRRLALELEELAASPFASFRGACHGYHEVLPVGGLARGDGDDDGAWLLDLEAAPPSAPARRGPPRRRGSPRPRRLRPRPLLAGSARRARPAHGRAPPPQRALALMG